MQDSIILQGKKFISARRAAQISDYTADYIGQLCRSKKINSKMLGRTWYVCEESLFMHRIGVLNEKVEKGRTKNSDAFPAAKIGRPLTVHSVNDDADVSAAEKSEKSVSNSSNETVSLEADGSLIQITPTVALKVIHNSDAEIGKINSVTSKVSPHVSRKIILKRALSSIGLAALIIFLFGSVTFIGLRNLALVGTDNVESTSSAMDSVSDFFRKGWKSILALFGVRIELAERSANIPYSTEGTNNRGMVVVPRNGKDESETIESIKQSFSDEVSVRMDPSGTAGVVTPEFKNKKGNDYLYVMVPVNGTRGP